jgi:hypothetical protein
MSGGSITRCAQEPVKKSVPPVTGSHLSRRRLSANGVPLTHYPTDPSLVANPPHVLDMSYEYSVLHRLLARAVILWLSRS